MPENRLRVLIVNGIRNDGSVDGVRANQFGQFSFQNSGSAHVSSFLPRELIDVHHFTIDHHHRQQINLRHVLNHDLVFCEIAEPDSHSIALHKATELHDAVQGRIPWINDPHRIPETRRDRIPDLLAGIDGVIAPRTLRLKLASASDLETVLGKNAFPLPALLRPCGSHGGENLLLLESLEQIRSIDCSIYRQAFLTRFYDCGQAGIYSKYRFAVVAGEPLLRHVMYLDHWNIHTGARAFMADRPDLQRAEQLIVDRFEEDLKVRIRDRIAKIHERVGLDYFGIDCTVWQDQLVLFEVNANMNILLNNQPLPNIFERLIEQILGRIMNNLIQPACAKSTASGRSG